MTFSGHPLAEKIGVAVATASLLTGGGAILTNKIGIVKLRGDVVKISGLQAEVSETNKELHRLNIQLAVLLDRQDRDNERKSK